MSENNKMVRSDPFKKIKRSAPLYILIMAVIAALPFLFVRLFVPAERAGRPGEAAPAPTLAMDISDQAAEWATNTLAGLTLERKIAQIVTADIAGGYIPDGDPRLERWLSLARDHGLGMFVLYGGTPRDVAHLLNRLQKAAEIPLLISADFEGGPGQQVVGASEYPANMGFAAAGDEDLMYRAASAAAVEGRAMGIHLTYTPVCDIAWDPDNPAESVRSFGGDLDLLGRMVRAYVRGYHENGMLTSAKHFPGRGDVANMPQNPGWAWIDKPAAEVESQEFRAFKHGIDAGVDFVMTEHIAVPSVTDGSDLPASVEGKLVTGWLKGKLGFRGVVTSDDLWYDNVVARFGAEEVAVRAFEAGHDVILKPKDPVATIAALAAAVRSGRIPESRVDEAARKVLTLKARLGLSQVPIRRRGPGRRVRRDGGPSGPRPGGRRQVADDAQERRGRAGRGGRRAEDRQHRRPEGGRRPRAGAAGGEARGGVPRDAELHAAAGRRSGLLRDGVEGGRGVRPGGAVALRRPESDGRRGAASRRRPGLYEKSRSRRSRRPSWPCPTEIPSSSARSRRSAPSSSATASGAGSGTRRSTSTRSSRRSREISCRPAGSRSA